MYIDLAETRLLFNPPGAEQNAIFFRANPKDFQKFHEYSMQSRAKNQDLAVRQSQPEANKKWPNGSYEKKMDFGYCLFGLFTFHPDYLTILL